MDMHAYWHAALTQDAAGMRGFFCDDAVIRWHCTNERFTVAEFVRANCEYPGVWSGEIERCDEAGASAVTAVRVFPKDGGASFHVVSFFSIADDKITALDEYWADDGSAPEWRRQLHIGRPIRA